MNNAAYDLIQKTKCRLIIREPFYGSIIMNFQFREEEQTSTIGVSIHKWGKIDCPYNPNFINKLSIEQFYGILKHEAEHIIREHCTRHDKNKSRHKQNLAADMAVNGKKTNPTSAYKDGNEFILPMGNKGGIYIPEQWDPNLTMEEFYDKIPTCEKCGNPIEWDPNTGKAKPGHQCPQPGDGALDMVNQLLDDHNVWDESEISGDEARQTIKRIVNQAIQNAPGKVPGHLQTAIDNLNSEHANWKQQLKQYFGRHTGRHRRTWSKPNRRYPAFGNPGRSNKGAATIGILVDTSGSTQGMLQQFFTEVEHISTKANTFLIQWDTALQSFTPKYRKGDWKKIEVKGLGGTMLDKAQEWIMTNTKPDAIIILTDTETKWLEQYPIPTLIATTDGENIPNYATKIQLPKT